MYKDLKYERQEDDQLLNLVYQVKCRLNQNEKAMQVEDLCFQQQISYHYILN